MTDAGPSSNSKCAPRILDWLLAGVYPPAPAPSLTSMHHRPLLLLTGLFALLLQPGPAYAYIDPNAGGMLFQLLAPVFAAVVGAWLFLRRWIAEAVRNVWHRLTGRRPE